MDPVLIVLTLMCLLGTIYFTIAESSLLNFSHARLDAMDLPERRRKAIDRHLDGRNGLILAATLLNAACNVLFVMLVSRLSVAGLEGQPTAWHFIAVFGLSLIGVVLIGELIPWAFVARHPEPYLGRFLAPVWAAARVLRPLLAAVLLLNRLIGRVAGFPEPSDDDHDIDEEILSVVASGEKDGEIEEDQKELFENVVEFRDADVAEVMTPRTGMVSVEISTPLREAVEVGCATGHSRLPVYEGNRDQIKGVLYLRDVLFLWAKSDETPATALASVIREPVFVPETKQIAELLREMRVDKFQIAIVVDEYGGTSGLITTEDIVEEIVGEIQDEYDRDLTEDIRHVSEHCIEADARTHVDDVNEALHISLPENDSYDTISGFVFAELGHVPERGETFHHNGVEITVLQADARRIHRLRITAHREDRGEAGVRG